MTYYRRKINCMRYRCAYISIYIEINYLRCVSVIRLRCRRWEFTRNEWTNKKLNKHLSVSVSITNCVCERKREQEQERKHQNHDECEQCNTLQYFRVYDSDLLNCARENSQPAKFHFNESVPNKPRTSEKTIHNTQLASVLCANVTRYTVSRVSVVFYEY